MTTIATKAQVVTDGLLGYIEITGYIEVEDYSARRSGKYLHTEDGSYDFYIMPESGKKTTDKDIERILDEARMVIITNGYEDTNLDKLTTIRKEMRGGNMYTLTYVIEDYLLALTFEDGLCGLFFTPKEQKTE